MQSSNLEAFLKEYRDEIHRSATEMLQTAVPDVTEELFAEFERTGERLGYEKAYFTRRKYLAILGMEAILRGREERNCRMNFRGEYGAEADGIGDEKVGAETDRRCDGTRAETDRACGRKNGGKTEPDFRVNSEEAEEKQGLEEVMKKLCGVIESVCAEETWALPAHVNRKAENWQVTVDLFASETAQTLANLMDELREELPEPLVRRMQEEICRRVLDPFFESEVPYSWWEGSEMNWNAVCAGAIGSVCIHFHNCGLALPAEFPACIRRVCSSLTHYIDGFSEDGACMEGLGYYTYGMAFYVNFMRELEGAFLISDKWDSDSSESARDCGNSDRSGFAVDSLYSKPSKESPLKSNELKKSAGIIFSDENFFGKLRRIAEFPGKCFFSDGRSLSFSDGDSRDTWRVGIWCALSEWFDDLPLPNLKSAAGVHADSCYRFVNLKMDIFETEKYLGREEENEKSQRECRELDLAIKKGPGTSENVDVADRRTARTDRLRGRADILPDAQWCIAESENGVGFACKGGHNDEPHNHNDIGHFIYEAGGDMFFTDLGAGEYTADYFGANRYQILCNSSAGHSVPVLNGENQRCGREYRCGGFTAYVDETPENINARGNETSRGAHLQCRGERGEKTGTLDETKTGGKDITSGERGKGGGRTLHVQMDIGAAWPQKEGGPALTASVRRTFHFDLQSGRLEIEDIFERTQWQSVSETLITQIPPQVEENKVYLRGDGGRVVIDIQGAGEEQSKSEHLDQDEICQKGQSKSKYLKQDAVSEKERIRNTKMEDEAPEIQVRMLEHRNHVGEAETVYAIRWDVRGSHTHICLRYMHD